VDRPLAVVRRWVGAFWSWYGRTYTLQITIATALFVLQIAHLIWLGGEVVAQRATGDSLFHVGGAARVVLVFVDWTEIPALISVSLVYLFELRERFSWKSVAALVFLNSQYLHIFWITDELVVRDTVGSSALPSWLAWIAILIDYLEVPVIVDTLRKVVASLRRYGVREVLRGRPAQETA
jgi:hypothetical protein